MKLTEVSDANTQIRGCTIGDIKGSVAYFFGMSIEELDQRSTTKTTVIPRQIAMYLARQITNASLAEIGRECGGMHHTTVTHSIARVEKQRKAREGVELAIRIILESMKC